MFRNRVAEQKIKRPKGSWYNFHTGKFAGNGQEIHVLNDSKERIYGEITVKEMK